MLIIYITFCSLARYKLDFVGAEEVRWNKGALKELGIVFFLWKGDENHQLGTGFFVHYRILSEVKRLEFVSNRMSYILHRGRWCNIIVLNALAPIGEKSDDSEDRL
jgi:hypothetical protein